MGKLDGKVALITGGTSGIGQRTVERFVEEGARVVFTGRQDDKGARLAEALRPNASYIHADVSLEADVKASVEHAVERFGRLDCIFNNAGAPGVAGPIETIEVERFDATLAMLVRGVFLGIKHAAPIMKRQGSGSIINNGSIAGLRTGYGPHVYSAAKAAVIHLSHSVAMELGESGGRVNCICPGIISTQIFARAFGLSIEDADGSHETLDAEFEGAQPIRRAGQALDIAQAAVWLASDDSSFVNGHALVVDGGIIGGRGWSESQAGFGRLAAALGVER